MPLIRLQRVSFRYSDALAVLDDIDLVLTSGWTGLVGPNGGGKSTLLQVLAGSLSPTSGVRKLEPDGARVAVCLQEVEERTADIDTFAWSWDGLSKRLQGRLGLDPDDTERWNTLSPGERKRWQIGAALSLEPDVLLLDEPTNHLDADARALLLAALSEHRGLGLVVSHDRALLDALTTRTLELSHGALASIQAPYSTARAEWQRELTGRLDARDRAQNEAQKKARKLDAARREQEAANRMRSTGRRMNGPKDSDARGILAQTKADWADASLTKRRVAMRRQSDTAVEALSDVAMEKQLGRSVFTQFAPSPQPFLALREEGPLVRDGRELASLPALAWGRTDRVRVAGRNGSGKTTLIEAMLQSLRVPEERLLVLSQNPPRLQLHRALERVHTIPADERGHLMSIVAALGVDPARLLSTSHPSPGEARKLLLADGLARQAWGLVLDEPTNHLDLPSIERLEEALSSYPGAILLVSHDDAFARACTTIEWRIEDGALVV